MILSSKQVAGSSQQVDNVSVETMQIRLPIHHQKYSAGWHFADTMATKQKYFFRVPLLSYNLQEWAIFRVAQMLLEQRKSVEDGIVHRIQLPAILNFAY